MADRSRSRSPRRSRSRSRSRDRDRRRRKKSKKKKHRHKDRSRSRSRSRGRSESPVLPPSALDQQTNYGGRSSSSFNNGGRVNAKHLDALTAAKLAASVISQLPSQRKEKFEAARQSRQSEPLPADDEEVDPLEAYMSGLQSEIPSSVKRAGADTVKARKELGFGARGGMYSTRLNNEDALDGL